MLVSPHNHLPVRPADLDDVKRRSGGYAESLALANGKVVDPAVRADHFPAGRDQIACSIGQALTLLGEVGVDEAFVIAAGHKADLLRIWLLGDRQAMLVGAFTDL